MARVTDWHHYWLGTVCFWSFKDRTEFIMYIFPNSQSFFPATPSHSSAPIGKNRVQRWSPLGQSVGQVKEVLLSWLAGFAVHPSSHFMLDRAEKLFNSRFWFVVQKRLLRGLAQEYIDLEHGCWEMASNPEVRIFLLFPCKKIIFLFSVNWSKWSRPLRQISSSGPQSL